MKKIPKTLAAAALFALVAAPAFAEQPPPDPRLAGPMIRALQGMLELRGAEAKALAEDAEKRIAELEKLCGEPCKPKAEPAAK